MKIRKILKFSSFFAVLTLCAAVLAFSIGAETGVLYGDVNGDGRINGMDVITIRKYVSNYDYVAGTSSVEVSVGADANADGEINGKDVLLLRKHMADYDYSSGEVIPTVTTNPDGTPVLPYYSESPLDYAVDKEETVPVYSKSLLENWNSYSIVFPNDSGSIFSDAFLNFNLAFKEKYGDMLDVSSDYGSAVPEESLEILVGNTNRAESAEVYETLSANDYFIGIINNRLLIIGGSERADAEAMNHFVSYLMGTEGIYYPKTSYRYKADYVVDTLTLGGVDISEYTVIRGNGMTSGEKKTLSYLVEIIADVCGVNMKTALSSADEQTYEILIGDTGRALTSKNTAEGTFSIEQTANKLALYGNGELVNEYAITYFIENILFKIPEGESYDIDIEDIVAAPYTLDTFVNNNLPDTFADLTDTFSVVTSTDTTLKRFLATADELPDEVTVLDTVKLSDYRLSLEKKQIFVSAEKGDDNNSGSMSAPLKTINKALRLMKSSGGGVVWIEGGNYGLTEGIVVNSLHSGTNKSPLFIKGYGNSPVVLTSNIIVDASEFKLVDTAMDSVAERLPDSVKDKVYCLNLYDLGWTESDIVSITKANGPARIYVDGEEFTLAQYPNAFYEDGQTRVEIKDLLYFKYVYDTGSVTTRDGSDLYWPWMERVEADPDLTEDSVLGWELRVLNDRDGLCDAGDGAMGEEILSWVNTGDIWYYGSVFEGWEHGYYTIDPECVHGNGLLGTLKSDGYYALKSVQPCSLGAKVSGNSSAGRNTYFLFNAIEALDAPGEWFIDKDTGNFYIYPKSDDITKQTVTYSGKNLFNLLSINGASNIVIDGIGANGASASAISISNSDNVVVQNITTRNTKSTSVVFSNTTNSALLYSNLSYSYSSMVSISHSKSVLNLTPIDVFIQNNTFSDTPSTVSAALGLGGCRAVVSHNHFIDCCLSGGGMEHIIEYNRFEGGNKFITDGGMVYLGGYGARGNHVRYNLFHMFKATHQAVYFDTMCSGNYAYYNTISTLGALTNAHKGWYSSSGHGNVCFGNVMVLRNKSQIDAAGGVDTDEGTEAIKKGDQVNESALFYYYYGDNAKGNSLAGHWWMGIKRNELTNRLVSSNQEAWNARYPDYMNFLEGTKLVMEAYELEDYAVYYAPQALSDKTYTFTTADDTVIWVPPYEYLDENGAPQTKEAQILTAENGQITVTYDDIAAMERLRRQPAFSVIKNNVILGGSTEAKNVITNNAVDSNYKGVIKGLTLNENNYLEFDYDKIMNDADNYDYRISDENWAIIGEEIEKEYLDIMKDIDYTKTGLTIK